MFFLCTIYVKEKTSGIEHVVRPIFCDQNFEKKKGFISLLETKPNLKYNKITTFQQDPHHMTIIS